ncbi:Predicted Zn-dependent peptidase [Tistlia consotensis]|uniref:Predicted Zn-dependent peptidase n=1 Tax=Tistlia consotensis USBA 355 TaxID=560819 RepID=A0A1Y6BAV8_9PROT|nr:pitrilysin family protein [Tistlia consotensis]SME94585.1 Predicted Zn-dependent peptidase [Tistlia consotensis USBA 355]SNR29436.1 Predicted Zn-dependent peptidase [Tistlia consotensis]
MSVTVTTLPNGLTVASDRMDTVESASIGVWVGVGTRHEPAEANGVAHLLEHMAFKGTSNRSAQAIAEEIEAVGGHLNAYTGRETTAYYAKVLADDLPLALDILSDILQRSTYDEEELKRERAVVLQEIGQAEDTPDDIIFDYFQEVAYPDQPIGWPVLGRPEIVAVLPRQALFDYQQSRYGARRMVLAAAGRLEHERLVELGAAAFGGHRSESVAEQAPPRYAGGEARFERDLEQLHLLLGFEGFGIEDPDYYPGQVFSTLFGGGMSSRLFQEVREKRGLVYSIFSFLQSQSDSGLFGLYAGTGEAEAGELLPIFCDELGKVAGAPVGEAELQRAKAQLKASVLMSRERTSARAEALGGNILAHGRPIPPEEVVAKIEAVGPDDILRLVGRLLSSPPSLTLLGPAAGVESYDRLLERLGGPAPRVAAAGA